jgi:hypothetical protein
MQACSKCAAALTPGASDCAVCGAPLRPEPNMPVQRDMLDPEIGIAANLWRGNYTLVKTYWLFGLLGSIGLGLTVAIAAQITKSPLILLSGLASLGVWQVFISVAIWRSAVKYGGAKIWSVLARVAIFTGFLQPLRATGELFGAL